MKKILMIVAAMAVAGWVQADMATISGDNVVGFAAVTAPGAVNTIVTVPFEACMGAGSAGMLADLVVTNDLTSHTSLADSADQLIVLTTNETGQVYYYYWLKAGDGWTGITSAKVMPDGSTKTVTPIAAADFPVARGLGFWIKRVASENSTLYIKGQVSSAHQATPVGKGLNLIGYGTVNPTFSLNTLNWTGVHGAGLDTFNADRVLVSNGSGGYKIYYYYVNATPPAGHEAFTNRWIESTSTGFALPAAITSGKGFWYDCKSEGGFTFLPDGN